jgi:hypothetical protein
MQKIYQNRYEKLVTHYKNNMESGYCEKHHIIPKCMGGTDELENLVLLPAKAHYIAHLLLCKIYPENKKILHAFAAMSLSSKNHKRKMNSNMYLKMRMARSNAMKGVPRPEHVKEKLRVPKKNKENYKKPKSEEHAQKISLALTGKKKTKDHIEKMILSQRKFQEQRTQEMHDRIQHFRNLFVQSGLNRKDFFRTYNLNQNTGKRYLRGL